MIHWTVFAPIFAALGFAVCWLASVVWRQRDAITGRDVLSRHLTRSRKQTNRAERRADDAEKQLDMIRNGYRIISDRLKSLPEVESN